MTVEGDINLVPMKTIVKLIVREAGNWGKIVCRSGEVRVIQ